MIYKQNILCNKSPEQLWRVLSDTKHFSTNDPYHHNQIYLTDKTQGLGTIFTVQHSYTPALPLPKDLVTCTITSWKENSFLELSETNIDSRKNHVQRFSIEQKMNGETNICYEILYPGLPWYMSLISPWVSFKVQSRMKDKLKEIITIAF